MLNFTLLSAPGYPELASNLIGLNVDRGLTGFVVADTPFRLAPNATSLQNYGNNTAGATADGEDGLVSYDEYMAAHGGNNQRLADAVAQLKAKAGEEVDTPIA